MASLEGQMLGPYKIIAQMGTGGMATVYKAYHARLDRYVAIKMLHEAFQEDQNFLARFQREAQIVARLEHPHIVPIFDFDDFHGRPFLVMKYIEGQTLKAVLEANPLTIAEILRLMPPVADALDYAHRQGVLHRDIKPSNIIIDSTGVPYLTDFGLARMAQLSDSTLSQDVLLGTPHYISPEQAMGNRDLDSRTDLYSLGVVLYELVVGRVPFSADTPFAVIHDQIYRQLPKPSSINPDLTPAIDAVLEKALAKVPADRYATATEMVEAFRSALQAFGVTTLNPERASIASESLAKLRDEQNRTEYLPPQAQAAVPAPPTPPAPPPVPVAPSMPPLPDIEDEPAPEAPLNIHTPFVDISIPASSRREMKKARRQAQHEAKREARRVVEASFDFSDTSRALENAGDAVRSVITGISNSFDKNNDPDLMPMDDEEAIRRRVEVQFNKRKEFNGHLISFLMVNALLWIIFGAIGGGFPWPLIVTLGWGSGLAAHAIETYYATGRRASRRLQAIQNEFYRVYGPNWPRADRKELKRIRTRVSEAVGKRREFVEHFAVYVFINVMLWYIYFQRSGVPFIGSVLTTIPFPWPALVTLGWGLGLVTHGFDAMTASSRERAVTRAIEQERERMSAGEKPKHDRPDPRLRLTEDGEFTESMVQEMEDEKPKRSGGRQA